MANVRVERWQYPPPARVSILPRLRIVSLTKLRSRLVAAAAVLGLAVILAGYGGLDDAGRISHRQDTALYLGTGAWPAGEYRDCAAFPTTDGSILFLGCVAGTEDYANSQTHPVKYWGKIRRPDRSAAMRIDPADNAWRWRCQLNKKDDITCWAVN